MKGSGETEDKKTKAENEGTQGVDNGISRNAEKETLEKHEKVIDIFSNSLYSFCSRLGFSGCLGFAAGAAMKQTARVALTTVGFAFLGLQTLSYCGYIAINWKKIRYDLVKALDTNDSGDIDAQDVRHYVRRFFRIVSMGGAGATGLSAGVYIGLTRT